MDIPLLQEVIFGLVIGSYIALGAIGFTLVYGLVNMINFAHGEFITIGAFVGYLTIVVAGLPLPVGIVATLAITAVVGWAIARVTFEPMNDAGAVPLLLMSIGLGFVLRNGMRVVAGPDRRSVRLDVTTYRFDDWGFFITSQQLLIIGLALVAVVALHVFLSRTMLGIAMRATSDNEDLALVSGIDTRRIRNTVWLAASALAGVAGLMLAISQAANPTVGYGQLLLLITAAILGGAGSPYGAIVGSYLLGIGITVSVAVLPSNLTELNATMAFVVLIVVLLIRPGGIVDTEVRAS
ncbi:branched-chain amino acid ABC-type transport system, permease component [Halovivax ruber XH-70]|uniref:Branched-chain amino acid ABC-type transport system, permease component n=1 Tax=Halovivax ruber (strain DSM 18193 / JCM 13892 / XH-70) TaxID=797302 RepID=L0I9U8_HALRX|nr:branched-chain amino acid ABC transporter permease [Halovivax ruber]AGB15016.1 branched-chain amino acid ABC-type transport system, permease component [Halovivax ruber XH-70]